MLKIGIYFVALGFAFSQARAVTSLSRADVIDLAILTATSRLASDHTEDAALLAYAASEPTAQAAFAPASDAAPPVANTEAMQTGRSAAVAQMSGQANVVPLGLSSATAGLATLNSLHGSAFDRLFAMMQRNALQRIEERYRGLALHGNSVAARNAEERSKQVQDRIDTLERLR